MICSQPTPIPALSRLHTPARVPSLQMGGLDVNILSLLSALAELLPAEQDMLKSKNPVLEAGT